MVDIATVHLEGKAIQWLQWYETTKPVVGWEEFARDFCSRFGKRHSESVVGELTKLKQVTTIEVYHDKFEELINRNKGLSESFLVDCFISGLKDEIKKAVNMFDPITLNRAFCLAQLQEETVEALTKKTSYSYKSKFQPTFQTPSNSTPKTLTNYAPKTNPSPTVPIKKITPAEMAVKRAQGLCYNCDENFVYGHKCKKQQLF